MREMNIYASKKMIIFMIITFLAFLGVCVKSMVSENPQPSSSELTHHLSVGLPILFSILCVAVLLFKLFSKQAEISLNQEGIRIGKSKPIAWGEVKGFSKITTKGGDSILIHVHHPQRIIDQEQGFFRRKSRQLKAICHGTPISIPMAPLDISTEELLTALRRFKQMADQRQAVGAFSSSVQ